MSFPVAVDAADVFGKAFGLKAIPVSYLVDEAGIIRLRGGGPDDRFLGQVEAILAETLTPVRAAPPALTSARPSEELERAARSGAAGWSERLALAERYAANERSDAALEQAQAAVREHPHEPAAWFGLGKIRLGRGEKQEALKCLKRARDLDPQNWRIRKQIWALEHPDRFYDAASPDYDWQKLEMQREKAAGIP